MPNCQNSKRIKLIVASRQQKRQPRQTFVKLNKMKTLKKNCFERLLKSLHRNACEEKTSEHRYCLKRRKTHL